MENMLLISVLILFAGLLVNLMLTLALARRLEATKKEMDMMAGGMDFETLETGVSAPDFEAKTVAGTQVTLADYAEKAVAFIFMSPTCKPCVEKLDSLHTLYAKAKAKGVELVLVNVDAMGGTAEFAETKSVKLPLLDAPRSTNSFADTYKAMGTPFYCLVNREGRVESTGLFGQEWEQLVQGWSA